MFVNSPKHRSGAALVVSFELPYSPLLLSFDQPLYVIIVNTTYNEFSQGVQTLYAQLLDSLTADIDGGQIPAGTIVSKTIKGREYKYAQYSELGRQRQVYLGPNSAELEVEINAMRGRWSIQRDDAQSRSVLVSMLSAAGVQGPDNASARVLELLERHSIFRAGGVLVGSHAFAGYGSMLGVKWGASWQTADIDIAKDSRLKIVVSPHANLPAALLESPQAFHPIPALDHRHPSTSFRVRGRQLSVDVLTPLVGPPVDGPIFLSNLNVAAQPLRFLDYLIEDHQPAALVARSGILVNLPTPARFALHKLIVAQERHAAEQAKAAKDINQATQLIDLLLDIRPGDLIIAWTALKARGPRWIKRVESSLQRLPKATLKEFQMVKTPTHDGVLKGREK